MCTSHLRNKGSNLSISVKRSVTQRTPASVHILTFQFGHILGVDFLQWANNASFTAKYINIDQMIQDQKMFWQHTWKRSAQRKRLPSAKDQGLGISASLFFSASTDTEHFLWSWLFLASYTDAFGLVIHSFLPPPPPHEPRGRELMRDEASLFQEDNRKRECFLSMHEQTARQVH